MLRTLIKTTILICSVVFAIHSNAQVTNSSITGIVRDPNAKPLEGASIRAEHQPTGTTYSTISNKNGFFNLPGVRTGGPYRIEVSYVGFAPIIFENVTLVLGEAFDIRADLKDRQQLLDNVVVSGQAKRKAGIDRAGASTNINSKLIQTMPTISRSINDFTRLTPQANGNNFAGRDGRFNNIQIDGANLNNNFGLNTDPLPGGANQPISIDAIEEITVNVSPFDVWQGNFTGAGINVITKSGTNRFKGSVYGLLRTEAMNGARVADFKLPAQTEQTNQIIGATLGGPIVRNKLFFFVSGEYETQSRPGILFSPAGGSGNGNVSATPVDSLRKLSDYVRQRFGYETGAFDNFPNFKTNNYKVLGRVDWNISSMHKLSVRYQEMVGVQDIITNATSVPTNPSFLPPGGSARTNLPNARFGLQSMSFYNSIYAFDNTVRSGTIELNSSKGGRWSNQLLGTFTGIRTTRTTPGATFPIVDIFNNNANNYMSVGYEPFSFNNDVKNDIYSITNNFKLYRGKHTLTFGGWYEQQYVGNMFMPGAQSSYVFRSLDDFVSNRAPISFAYTYSLIPDKAAVYSAEMRIAQTALYVQDDINFSDRFKMTIGLRGDLPIYLENPLTNPFLQSLTFPGKDGNPTTYNTGQWPKSRVLMSPRIGFRWDAFGDKTTIIRGGAGLFTGRVPFVWLTNMPSNSQMYQASVSVTNSTPGANMNEFLFNPNPDAYRDRFPNVAGQTLPNNAGVVFVDPDFKFPQIWRVNLATEKKFGNGWSMTLEAIYQKDVNAVSMRNANLPAAQSQFTGIDSRPRYLLSTASGRGDSARRIYNGFLEVNGQRPNIGSAVVLENTNRGGGIILTAEVRRAVAKGLTGSLAYTYTQVLDVAGNPGSVAASFWSGNPSIGTQNQIALARAGALVPHRIVGMLSYRAEYLKSLATTITLFYSAAHQDVFSWSYQNDMNGDGNAADLIFVPRNRSEINLLPITGATPFTVDQQWEALDQFITNNRGLNRIRGQYAERNGALFPWRHQLDLNLQQDVFRNIGNNKNTLRFTVDIFNFTNMLNRDWGLRDNRILNNMPLSFAGVNAAGQPTYRMQVVNGQLPTSAFIKNRSVASTWSMQIGLRYIFN